MLHFETDLISLGGGSSHDLEFLFLGKLFDFLFVRLAEIDKFADIHLQYGADLVETAQREIARGEHVFDGGFRQVEAFRQALIGNGTCLELPFEGVDESC